MKILVISQYFWPETICINDIVSTLRDTGNTVVVVTGKPNYPDGKIFEGYKKNGIQKEIFDRNIEVYRVPLHPRGKSGGLNLFRNYLSFIWNGLLWFPKLTKHHSFDSILVFAGSPNVFIPAIPLKWNKKAHLALWVQDLWPETLEAMGFITNKFFLWLISLVVRWNYYCADTILVQSKAFIKPVLKYTKAEKIVYYGNSIAAVKPKEIDPPVLPAELEEIFKTNFCAVFAGNIGIAQSIETLLGAAVILKDVPGIKIVLIGSGSMLQWITQKKAELGLSNLVLAGRFLPDYMPEFYRLAGCLVITLKDKEIFSYTIPSKLQAYLSAGKPIIASVNGEVARIIDEAGAGLTCAAEDAAGLADGIKNLSAMQVEQRDKMGQAGQKYFIKNFEIRQQAIRLVEILKDRISGKSGVVIDEEFEAEK